tara:strand:+ start:324 stop:875 length:552 start_codon:yes stop_codon:yes gene_type:complete
MGNRRFSRKRLFEVEKRGQTVDVGTGAGMLPALISATQHRQGQEIITEILLDLGTSKGTIIGGGADTDAIGVSGLPAEICQLTQAVFGVVTELRVVLLEASQGADTELDIELKSSSVDQGGSPGTSLITGLTTVGQDVSVLKDDGSLVNDFLFVCNGSGASSAQHTGGKLAIYVHGFAVPADL